MKKNPWIAAILNFFFMGAGYVYNGKRTWLGIGWTIGALMLTYIELYRVKPDLSDTFPLLFATVFLINICFAVDGYNEAKSI